MLCVIMDFTKRAREAGIQSARSAKGAMQASYARDAVEIRRENAKVAHRVRLSEMESVWNAPDAMLDLSVEDAAERPREHALSASRAHTRILQAIGSRRVPSVSRALLDCSGRSAVE